MTNRTAVQQRRRSRAGARASHNRGTARKVRRVGGFAVGNRVFHKKFGYGTGTQVEDNKLAIHFDVASDQKVMDAYVERA